MNRENVTSFTRAFFVVCLILSNACKTSVAEVQVSFQKQDGSLTPPIAAELAATPDARRVGLMYRKEMPKDRGMLFVFPDETERSFWMKNTYLELDIVYLNSNKRVVGVVERATPLTESPRPSNAPAKYALELIGGESDRLGISTGDMAIIEGNLPTPR